MRIPVAYGWLPEIASTIIRSSLPSRNYIMVGTLSGQPFQATLGHNVLTPFQYNVLQPFKRGLSPHYPGIYCNYTLYRLHLTFSCMCTGEEICSTVYCLQGNASLVAAVICGHGSSSERSPLVFAAQISWKWHSIMHSLQA